MKIHFIAVGGAIMHNLAIALKRKGNIVTGSDDKIADPALTNLSKEGIMPEQIGFFSERITADLDAVILGMHARIDNPELLKAQELGLKIYSFPEYIYEVAKDKLRIVIAGSHGKTTITSMVMHVLQQCGKNIDYMVGAKVKGFDTSVKLTEDASIIVLEGDEYLASPIHLESKFMFYKPHVALITGVAWDHINVFLVYEGYVNQFKKFAESVEAGGAITYYREDAELKKIFAEYKGSAKVLPYTQPEYFTKGHSTFILSEGKEYEMSVFGAHNMQNIEGARIVCNEVGISNEDFMIAISSFEGAANRLQFLGKNEETVIYKDFAHSPSKLKATVKAMREQFADRQLVAVMELHTFSSLNKDFLSEYNNSMDAADEAIVFIDKEAMLLKRMPDLNESLIRESFGRNDLQIFTEKEQLIQYLLSTNWKNKNLLLMTSGQFGGMKVEEVRDEILKNK